VLVTQIVLLNNVDHADLRVARRFGAATGDAVNQVLVFPSEFEALQREYVILFRRGAGGFQAVALLGLDRDENLFLDGETWRARYVPAVQARGPFSIGLHREGLSVEAEPKVNIDLDDPRVGDADGDPLFLRHGGAAPCLEAANQALSTLYQGMEMAAPMFQAFEDAGLLEPVTIDVTIAAGRRYDLDDVYTIARERLFALDGPALETLHRAGWLASAFHVASSLGNLDALVAMKNARDGRS
jgi:hypothetical protein